LQLLRAADVLVEVVDDVRCGGLAAGCEDVDGLGVWCAEWVWDFRIFGGKFRRLGFLDLIIFVEDVPGEETAAVVGGCVEDCGEEDCLTLSFFVHVLEGGFIWQVVDVFDQEAVE